MNAPVVQVMEFLLNFVLGIQKNRPLLPDAPCILIANHNSALDTYVLASLLGWDHKRRTRVAAARDTFGNGLLGWFARTTLDTVLVERRPTKGQDPLEPLKALLVEGRSLVLYPEGTRGEPGDLVPFKRGIGLLAMAFPEIPIYAIYIRGVERCLGRKEVLLVPFQVRLMADHTPLCGGDFPPLPGEGERERSARIALALENRLRALGGLGPREDALEGINPS